jgi:V/A-type H+-transporting ATPase subunit D
LRDLIPVLLQVAEQRAAVVRVAAELRKTQRRCNALAKVWIPVQRETLDYIEASLEEREREFLVMLKRVRERLRAG